ncbi:J domain-containing protein [Rubrobacter indicoceani]|uniref:J domain-containing protein n=1 Tax=Rubrobacter indicoceani TaxID=2051957 RepID=UPI000E5C5625|nr:J domain-containing protein [Rubrobacter indicoceani]
MSLPRRFGRFARGFVSGVSEGSDPAGSEFDRSKPNFEDYLRTGVRRGENLRDALGVAWRSASEEWRRAEERRIREEQEEAIRREREFPFSETRRPEGEAGFGERMRERVRERVREDSGTPFKVRKYSPEILRAYDRLGLLPGAAPYEVDRKRRDMVKKFHPDRFTDPEKRVRAEKVTAEINAAHDLIARNSRR